MEANMEEQYKPTSIHDMLNYGIEDLQDTSVSSTNDLISYFATASNKRGLVSNRIRDGAFCINQVNHEISANDILVTQLQANAMEEEKKLAKYPELMAEIEEQIEETWRDIDYCIKEKETLKPQTFLIKKKWEEKISALNDMLGFNTETKAQKVSFTKCDEEQHFTDTSNKKSVDILFKEGSFDLSDVSTQSDLVESHVRKLNRGMPIPSFCYELRKKDVE